LIDVCPTFFAKRQIGLAVASGLSYTMRNDLIYQIDRRI
jgi:hypothetical protein